MRLSRFGLMVVASKLLRIGVAGRGKQRSVSPEGARCPTQELDRVCLSWFGDKVGGFFFIKHFSDFSKISTKKRPRQSSTGTPEESQKRDMPNVGNPQDCGGGGADIDHRSPKRTQLAAQPQRQQRPTLEIRKQERWGSGRGQVC